MQTKPLRPLILMVLAIGCTGTDPEPAPMAQPPAGPMNGYYAVTFDLSDHALDADEIREVTVAGVSAYALESRGDHELRVMVQGASNAGPAEIVLITAEGPTSLGKVFEYLAPQNAYFERVVSLGASLTQGVQRGVPSHKGALMSPAAQVARQMGAYFPLPLLIDGLFPQIEARDLGPAPDCTVPSIAKYVANAAAGVLLLLRDPESNQFGYQYARVDPDILVHNLAVGGSVVGDVVNGPAKDNLGVNFVGHLVHDPYGAFLQPVEGTQLGHVEALEPTLILSTDLFYNDIGNAILQGSLDPAAVTDLDVLNANTTDALARLAATGAQVFIANMPRPGLLPAVADFKRKMDPDEADQALAQIEALAAAANAHLEKEAQRYPNVHIVDTAGRVAEIEHTGLLVGETLLRVKKLGGLLGLDGVHFTNTGYAFMANLFIEAVNDVLGTDVPFVDVEAVLAGDPEAPSRLRASELVDCR